MCWESEKPPKPSEPTEELPSEETTTETEDTPVDIPIDCTIQQFGPEDVDEWITEVISNAPYPYQAWNGTYDWLARFSLFIDRATCTILVTVRIRVEGQITAQQLTDWKTAIEAKWNGKVVMNCIDGACPNACPSGYAVVIDVAFVSAGEHYVVTANNVVPTTGVYGNNGTLDMANWGVTDLVDITHEFGHMLGNTEEYFTTNGVDYTYGGTERGWRDPSGGIMNNPANDPFTRNYAVIEAKAAALMGSAVTCTTSPYS